MYLPSSTSFQPSIAFLARTRHNVYSPWPFLYANGMQFDAIDHVYVGDYSLTLRLGRK
jgi:hypothetical protein